jgi:hypothetical protein
MSTYPATCLLGHRLNAFRLNYLVGKILINIGGAWTDGAQDFVIESLTIADRLNEVPNTLIATVRGAKPIEGSIVRVVIGSRNGQPLFVGNVLRVTRRWAAANPAHVLYDIEAIDPTWRLTAKLFSNRYRNLSASVIAADVLTYAPSGFTSQIEPNLPVLDEITFTNVNIMDAFTQLANRIGGYTLVDYNAVVYLFRTPTVVSPPTPLNAAHPSLAGVTYTRDLSQIVTRALVEGGGGNAIANVAEGGTIIPVDVIGWYLTSGGLVRPGPQYVGYTGIQQGGAGAFAGEGTVPTSAPNAALYGHVDGAGVDPGAHSYAYTWITGNGQSIPSPVATVTTSGPPPAMTPGPVLANETNAGYFGNLIANADYVYAHTFTTAATYNDLDPTKESALSVPSQIRTIARAQPAAPRLASETTGGGSFVVGATYYWAFQFSAAPEYATLDPALLSPLSALGWYTPTPPPPGAPGSATSAGVSVFFPCPAGGPFRWIHFFRGAANAGPETLRHYPSGPIAYPSQGGEQYFRDFGGPTDAGGVPTVTGAQQVGVRIAGPAATPYTFIHLWRSPANGGAGALKWINVALPFLPGAEQYYRDGGADGTLTGNTPPAQGQSINQVMVTGIAPGPLGVTQRYLYRTAAGSSQLRLITALGDNTTTAYLDLIPDTNLQGNAPTVDTSGIIQTAKLISAGSTSMTMTSTAPFSATGGYVIVNQQVIRYTGVTATALVGIPPFGDGAILQSIPWGTPVTAAPALVGVSGVKYPIRKGDQINVLAVVEDAAAQQALAALIGGNGVRESLLQDGRISITEATARGRALLAAHKDVLETFAHRSRDPLTRSGATVTVDLPAPTDIHGAFRLQDVTIAHFNGRGLVMPTYDARSSSQRFTFEDLVRQMANTTPPPATGEDR